MIDDGSTDNCPQKCDEWAKQESRIKVIHKQNAGLGMARNTGIENAEGEYVCFLDSDDYIELDAIERCINSVKEYHSEVVLFGFYNVGTDGKIKKRLIPQPDKFFYEETEVQTYILPNMISPDPKTGKETNLWMSACSGMYSMAAIKRANWRFVSERQYISEDVYSLLYLYKKIKSVSVLPAALYYYCENSSSLTHTYRADRYEKNKFCYDACQKACMELGYGQEIRNRLAYQYVSNIIGALKLIVATECSKNIKKRQIEKIITDQHFQTVIRRMDIHKEPIARKILLLMMKVKQSRAVYVLVKLKLGKVMKK